MCSAEQAWGQLEALGTCDIKKLGCVTVGPVFGGDDSSVHTDKTEREGIWEMRSEGGRVGTSVPLSEFKAESPRV